MRKSKRNAQGWSRGSAVRHDGRRRGSAPGSRLAEAFEAVERFPVLLESRERVMKAAAAATPKVGEIIEAVESDVALTIAVLQFANRGGARNSGTVAGIPVAVEILKPSVVLAIAGTSPTYDFFESNGGWEPHPEQFRIHALASQRAADRVGRAVGFKDRDELAVCALLHDIGRLVLLRLHPGYQDFLHVADRPPEQRLRIEREKLGIDHAIVGGVLARRWNLPSQVAVAIERHHAEDSEGLAALIATADMLAHYGQGEAVTPENLDAAAARAGIGQTLLRELLYELPYPRHDLPRAGEPCPLSERELHVLRLLAQGKVYKQIAAEMELSVSTIRTHLHNVYRKIGAVDRAQAVLTARDRGWI
jgi:putative nucleotidyltransferase with HDIG domain